MVRDGRDEFEHREGLGVRLGAVVRFGDSVRERLLDERAGNPTLNELLRPLAVHEARHAGTAASSAAAFCESGRTLDELFEGGRGGDDGLGAGDVREEARVQGREFGVGELAGVEVGDEAGQGEVDFARVRGRGQGRGQGRDEVRDRRREGAQVGGPGGGVRSQ